MKISQLYGKTITCENGKRRGFILGPVPENDTIKWLICCDESEKRFFVACKNVQSLGGDAHFSKAEKACEKTASLKLGKAVYTSEGKFMGYLEDCILSGLKITHAIVGGKKFAYTDLIIGDVCLLKDGGASAENAAKDMFIQAVCAESGIEKQ